MLTLPWGLRVSRGEMATSTQCFCSGYLYYGQRSDTSNLMEKRCGPWDTVYHGGENMAIGTACNRNSSVLSDRNRRGLVTSKQMVTL